MVSCLGAAAFSTRFRSLRKPAYDPWKLRAGGIVALVVLFRACQAGKGETQRRSRLMRGAQMAAGAAVSRYQHSLYSGGARCVT